jgi:phosphocarrier protein
MSADHGEFRRATTIVNQRGLHARAAARIAKVAECFDSAVVVSSKGETVSALSIMGMLMLAAAKGTPIEIRASGIDAAAAVSAIIQLIESGFEEEDFPGS